MTGSPAQTLALAVGIGSIVTMVSVRLGFPAVLPLLIVGILVGKSGIGIIEADQLGGGLLGIITVSVALLIFEGSLALDRRTLFQSPRAVRGLLTIGVVATWMLGTLGARFVVGLDWPLSVLLASMLIVTGPTVVQPILRRFPLKPNIQSALLTEGILIDPIGAVIAVATLEAVLAWLEGEADAVMHIAWVYAGPLIVGLAIGAGVGFAGAWLMRIAERRTGSFTHAGPLALIGMGACMTSVGLAEIVAREAGLAAAAACGVVIANSRLKGAEELRRFKEQISTFLVGALFLLLAARFELSQLRDIGWREILFVVLIIVVVRPVSVIASTWGTVLSWRERAFASFLAPRGIVAASLASIVAIEIRRVAREMEESARVTDPATLDDESRAAMDATIQQAQDLAASGRLVETLVFLVILATVALGGTLAGPVASLLKVKAGRPNGILIVGGQRLGRDLAVALAKLGAHVRLVDTNAGNIAAASSWGLPTHLGDATDSGWLESEVPMEQVGWVFTCTDNDTVDTVVARWAERHVGADRAFRWWSNQESPPKGPGRVAFQYGRPLSHLLFQLDIDAARIETRKDVPEGFLPFAAVTDGKARLLAEGADVPEGADLVGLRIGPREKKEPKKDSKPRKESDEPRSS